MLIEVLRSTKMYQSRITKWGIDKNNKELEAYAIIRLNHQRIGKPSTETLLRGRPVDVRKTEMYLKRKGISIEDVLNSSSNCAPAEDLNLVCRTPPPVESQAASHGSTLVIPSSHEMSSLGVVSSRSLVDAAGQIPQRIELPDGLRIVESIFMEIREFMMSFTQIENQHIVIRPTEPRLLRRCQAEFFQWISLNPESFMLGLMRPIKPPTSDPQYPVLVLALILHATMWIISRGDTNIALGLSKMCSRESTTAAGGKRSVAMCRLGRIFSWVAQLSRMEEPIDLISDSTRRLMLDTSDFLLPSKTRCAQLLFSRLHRHNLSNANQLPTVAGIRTTLIEPQDYNHRESVYCQVRPPGLREWRKRVHDATRYG